MCYDEEGESEVEEGVSGADLVRRRAPLTTRMMPLMWLRTSLSQRGASLMWMRGL